MTPYQTGPDLGLLKKLDQPDSLKKTGPLVTFTKKTGPHLKNREKP